MDWEVTVIDRLNYASAGYDRLRDIDVFDKDKVRVFATDLTNDISEELERELGQFNYIVHMGAETHVDNSIDDPEKFVKNNVIGTLKLLQFARRQKNLEKFIYFSTDEVFGPAPEGTSYKEWDRYNSGNPYSASKAGAEELCLAFHNTYGVPVVITHTMNAYGERQHPEKFIPMVINKVLKGEKVTIHSNKDKTKAGSRFYIHCRNIADAIFFLLKRDDVVGDKFNIVGEKEVDNLELAQFIAKVVGKPLNYEMTDFHSSRPGHDLRYALDGTKMEKMGWKPPISFEDSLTKTIEWTLGNDKWLSL